MAGEQRSPADFAGSALGRLAAGAGHWLDQGRHGEVCFRRPVHGRERHPRAAWSPAACGLPGRATRRDRKQPSDADIERGLRERAVTDPRAAEILLRWLQRPRTDERVHGVGLDTMSEAQLEALYAGLVRIAALSPNELQVLVQSLLADKQGAA
jgi:hypothetical protein